MTVTVLPVRTGRAWCLHEERPVTITEVRARWDEFVAVASRRYPTVKPLLPLCFPLRVIDGTTVALVFTQAFLMDVADRRRPLLSETMTNALGVHVSVVPVLADVNEPVDLATVLWLIERAVPPGGPA